MTNNFNSLEKKILTSFIAGMGASVVITAVEIGYILPQKPFWTGKEAAAMLLASVTPMLIGALPMVYHATKECYREIKEKGFFPRVDY